MNLFMLFRLRSVLVNIPRCEEDSSAFNALR